MSQQRRGGEGGGVCSEGRRAYSPAPLVGTLAGHTPLAFGPSLQPADRSGLSTSFCCFVVSNCTLLGWPATFQSFIAYASVLALKQACIRQAEHI